MPKNRPAPRPSGCIHRQPVGKCESGGHFHGVCHEHKWQRHSGKRAFCYEGQAPLACAQTSQADERQGERCGQYEERHAGITQPGLAHCARGNDAVVGEEYGEESCERLPGQGVRGGEAVPLAKGRAIHFCRVAGFTVRI